MADFSGFDANQALVDFFGNHASTLPIDVRDKIRDAIAGTNSLEALIVSLEALYAMRGEAEFTTEGAELIRDLGCFVENHNFYGMAANGRARGMITAAERIIDGGAKIVPTDLDYVEPVPEPDA